MTPEPKLAETLSAKKDRRANEAKVARAEYEAGKLAVDKNMARLRELRLAAAGSGRSTTAPKTSKEAHKDR